ncbi:MULTISPECIES: PP2C family serine/threonine-protein phosphatase [unclassified Bradyrhizobium]
MSAELIASDVSWRVAAAKAVGTAHIAQGTGCQDAFRCEILRDHDHREVLVAAVSDGAGSASRSEEGAAIACGEFVSCVARFLANGRRLPDLDVATVLQWIDQVRHTIAGAALREDAVPSDYACTLLAVIAQGRHLATLQIGDGAIVFSDGREWRWCYWPMHGEHANSTFFVTSDDVHAQLAFDLQEIDFEELALFTDGLEWMLLHRQTHSVHAPFFSEMMPPVRKLSPGVDGRLSCLLGEYLGSPAVNARTNDDKTLVLATRRGASQAV